MLDIRSICFFASLLPLTASSPKQYLCIIIHPSVGYPLKFIVFRTVVADSMYTYFYFVLIKLWQMCFLQVSLLRHRRRDLRGPTLTANPVAGKQQWLKIFVVDLDCALFFSLFSDDMANERQHPTHTHKPYSNPLS